MAASVRRWLTWPASRWVLSCAAVQLTAHLRPLSQDSRPGRSNRRATVDSAAGSRGCGGTRPLALEWEQTDKAPWLDFARNRIWLPAELVKAVEDQWVPLDPELRAILQTLPHNGRKVFHFTSAATGEPLSDSGVSLMIARLAKEARVRLSMRALRRGFGCRYAGKVPAQVLQRLMRHANISTTVTFYANVDHAVEETVLGPQRNTLRHTEAAPAPQSREG